MRGRHPPRPAFGADDGAVSAVEFALVLPILIVLMLAGIQLVQYVNATRRVEMVAASISQMISQAVPPPGSTTATVNAADLHFAYDSTLVLFPYVMRDAASKNTFWANDISVSFSGIRFTAIPGTNCAPTGDQSACYVANVGWTSTYGYNNRPCLTPQTAANDNAAPTPNTLPRSVFGSTSVIAVDIWFTFTPTFGSKYLPAVAIRRSVFVQPRYASYVDYSPTSDGIAVLCPGYT